MENITNDTQPEVNTWSNSLASFVLFFAGIPAIVCYSIFWLILFRYRHKIKNVYYQFSVSLTVSNTVVLLFFIFYAAPCSYFRTEIGGITLNAIFGAINNTSYFSNAPMMQMLCFNRFISIRYPHKVSKIYTPRNTVLMILFCWLYGSLFGIINLQPCCYFRYFYESYSFSWDIDRFGSYVMSYIDLSNTIFTSTVCLICTVATFAHLRKNRQKIGTSLSNTSQEERIQTEKSLFTIFSIVTGWYFVQDVVFIVVPMLTTSKWGGFAVSLIFISHLSLDGFINLFYNKVIFRHFCKLVKHSKKSNTIGVMMVASTKQLTEYL